MSGPCPKFWTGTIYFLLLLYFPTMIRVLRYWVYYYWRTTICTNHQHPVFYHRLCYQSLQNITKHRLSPYHNLSVASKIRPLAQPDVRFPGLVLKLFIYVKTKYIWNTKFTPWQYDHIMKNMQKAFLWTVLKIFIMCRMCRICITLYMAIIYARYN